MYNGIGLNTPRGSGTNGFVQTNAAHVKEWKVKKPDGYREILDIPAPKIKDANKDILNHEKKRKVEVEVYKYRLELEDKGIAEEEIEKQIEKKRQVLLGRLELEEMDKSMKRPSKYVEREKREEKNEYYNKINKEGHLLKEAHLKKNDRAMEALGIRRNFKAGDSFDFDGEKKKQRKEEEEKEEFIKKIQSKESLKKTLPPPPPPPPPYSPEEKKSPSPEEERRSHSPVEKKRRKRSYSPDYKRKRNYSPDYKRNYSPKRRE
jgi:serine/arginine repetitive matrix protein 2